MKRVTWRSVVAIVLILLVFTLTIGLVVWMQGTLGPSETAMNALGSDEQVRVTQEAGLLTFGWAGVESSTGFIFYPGARVDYRSYAPVLRRIAARGYFVVLTPMPLNLALFNGNAADRVMAKYPEVEHWVIGGHSLGGVAAAGYAAGHPAIEGLVLWASYPANDALKDREIKALSIYGSNDALANAAKIDESRALLPPDTVYVEIAGGNHSQFGSYGLQPGDGAAGISPEEQWTQIGEATAAFLESISSYEK
jgi:pimeloyl-ACP methyl ester carboxylesterase